MSGVLPIGHRRRGAGIALDSSGALERALVLGRHKGSTWYVDSGVTGGASGNGDSWSAAVITLAEAVSLASADDVILLAPGHAETIAGAKTISKAGLQIIGLGMGSRRPTFTMSATASKYTLSGASVALINLLFLTTAANTITIGIAATDVLIEGCEFRRTSGTVPAQWIDVGTGAAANACDRTRILRCKMNTLTNVGATSFIELGAVADSVEIRDCSVYGDFSDACIHNPTGFILTNLVIADCDLGNVQTGDHSVELVSACTGRLIRNMYQNDMTQATGSDPGSCWNFENYHSDLIDASAIISPAVT